MLKPKKTGRPSLYSEELAARICERIALGESLRGICSEEDMPSKVSVLKWLASGDKPEFVAQYVRAREDQADTLAEEILEIADDASRDVIVDDEGRETVNQEVIARSRLRVDARKWLASKMAPKKYGDKITQEVTGANGTPIELCINFVEPKQ